MSCQFSKRKFSVRRAQTNVTDYHHCSRGDYHANHRQHHHRPNKVWLHGVRELFKMPDAMINTANMFFFVCPNLGYKISYNRFNIENLLQSV